MKLMVCTMERHRPHQSCSLGGSISIAETLEHEASFRGLKIEIERSDCLRMCRNGPCVRLLPAGKDWLRVSPKDIVSILDYVAEQPDDPSENIVKSIL